MGSSFSNTNSNNNILIRLSKIAMFDEQVVLKNQYQISDSDEDGVHQVLLDSIRLLNNFIKLDENGKTLVRLERIQLIKVVEKLFKMNTVFLAILQPDNNEENREVEEVEIINFSTNLYLLLEELVILLRSAINTALIAKAIPDFTKIVEQRLNISDYNEKIKVYADEAKRIVDDIALLPTKQQVSNYSQMFEIDATKFGKVSLRWLIGTFLCLLGIIISAYIIFQVSGSVIFNPITGNPIIIPINQLIINQISRLLLISCLFYALAICNKNYKSSKHNEILNKHRANALASFQAFVESPSADAATKNAVLLEATKTIYGIQQTGYVQTENDDSPNKIIEMIQSVQPK